VKYYIIAGEASGDLHGSNLIKELRRVDADANIRCWGGDKMQAAGGQVVKHIKDLAFMGFMEVLKHLGTILNNVKFCKHDILSFQPDVVILIDYPGFNFRLFKFLQQHQLRVFYYISPQIWAWRTSRVFKIKKYVERMFVIFPFEKDFYAKYGVQVDFIGHPLLDELQNTFLANLRREKMIALLPGSRKQEIAALLPEYLKVIPHFPEYEFVVTGLSNIGEDFYRQIIGNTRCRLVLDKTYETLHSAEAALVTSGTATLETALHHVPQVICYKGSWISYFIAHIVIDKSIGYIGIVNLIAKKKIAEELIQADVNEKRLKVELQKLLEPANRGRILYSYTELRELLGNAGASAKTAQLMWHYLKDGK
jgi:lipid-A-disaccharide synthase